MAETTHRKIFWVSLVIAAVAVWVVLISPAALFQRASAQEPTPSPTELAPPAAPNLTGFDDRLSWVDNSDNEDGFRLYISVNGEEHVFEVGENVTVFEYPDGLISACGTIDYEIMAFNKAGESSPTSGGLIADCFLGVEPEILPETGSGQEPDAFPSALAFAALAGAGLVLISVARLSLRRR